MTALVTKQLPLVAGAPDGFKNLRALILELAVRGKLVHQDPEEQPVSDLLAQISTALDKSKAKNKARKSTAVEQGLEPFFEAPVGWVWVRLGDLLSKIGAGSTPLGGKQAYLSSGVKFLRSQNVWNDGLRLDDVAHISIDTHQRMSGTHVAAGDILFNITGASIGRCAVAPCWFDTGNVSQHVTIIRPCVPDIGSYLHKVLMSGLVQDTVMAVQVGVSREGLSIGKLAQFPIPLPPLAEQHRIVAKVDELMALCDRLEADQADAEAAHTQLVQALLGSLTQAPDAADFRASWQRLSEHFHTLFTTEASIDALKQTVLQLAVMGMLVPQLQRDGGAGDLLASIAMLNKAKELAPAVVDDGLRPLPGSWCLTRIETLAHVGTGATPSRTNPAYFDPPEISWVTSGETSQAFIGATEQMVSSRALAETNLTVYPVGTLVIAMYGQGKTRGQISELQIEACTNQACAALLLLCDDPAHRRYVKYFFEKSYDELRSLAAGGAQPNLNLGKIKETLIPLPPLAEQHRIVAKVDELMALCDQLKTQLQQAHQQHAQLASVLVEQAVSA
jgi:type I restriction enzyme S subunit